MKKILRSCLFLFALLAFAHQVQAQNPKISIQGTLKTADGTTVGDGTYNVKFRLYNAINAAEGAQLWEEAATVEVTGGIYSHYLGSITPLNAADFATTLFLGVKVGSYELTPRTELSYSPYSFAVYSTICSGALGDIKHSILNPTEFASVNGACWVPMDGRALAATDQLRIKTGMTNVPDGSGLFIRSQEFSGGADNDAGRTSSSTIAQVQQDDLESHNHTMNAAGSHQHSVGTRGYLTGAAAAGLDYEDGADGSFDDTGVTTQSAGSHTHTINNTGGSETRPKNLNFWVYIRIN